GQQRQPARTGGAVAQAGPVRFGPHVDLARLGDLALQGRVQAVGVGRAVGQAADLEDRPGGRGTEVEVDVAHVAAGDGPPVADVDAGEDRKSTRLNSSHVAISYAVFCLKKKMKSRLALDMFDVPYRGILAAM